MVIDATPWARQALTDEDRRQLSRLLPGARLYLAAREPGGPYVAILTPRNGEGGRRATGPTLQTAIDRVLA